MRKGITVLLLAMAVVALTGLVSAYSITGTQSYCYEDSKPIDKTTGSNTATYDSSTIQNLKIGSTQIGSSTVHNNQYLQLLGSSAGAKALTGALQTGSSTLSVATSVPVKECDNDVYVDKFEYESDQAGGIAFQTTEGNVWQVFSDPHLSQAVGTATLPSGVTITEEDGFAGAFDNRNSAMEIRTISSQPWEDHVVEIKEGNLFYTGSSDACVYMEGNHVDMAFESVDASMGGSALGKITGLDEPGTQWGGVAIAGDFQWDSKLTINK